MKIQLIGAGNKMPTWLAQGFKDYANRMPKYCQLSLTEVSSPKRSKNMDEVSMVRYESDQILASIPENNHVIAMEVTGKQWSSEELAKKLETWMQAGKNVSLLIGGANGLSNQCRARASNQWSLSKLTFPHMLMRLLLAEQIYRGLSIIQNHPYHRAD